VLAPVCARPRCRSPSRRGQKWYDQRIALPPGNPDRKAAEKAHAQAGTPGVTHFDGFGRADVALTPIVGDIDYDEKGRRKLVTYASGTETEYSYDELSFRLQHFKTTRASDGKLLQSLKYYFDAAGNIVQTEDSATHSVYFSAPTVPDGGAEYTYDALYRLIEAKGREHAAGAHQQRDETGLPIHSVPHPNDPSGLRRYSRSYEYDPVGNLLQMKHTPASGPPGAAWTRDYSYAAGSNRLLSTTHPGGVRSYAHDAHGSMPAMPHLSAIDYDHLDQTRHVQVTAGQDVYFVYDAAGQRVRKVYEHAAITEERIYLGGYELYRKHVSGSVDTERETVHIADDARRVCMVETLTVTAGSPVPAPTVTARRS